MFTNSNSGSTSGVVFTNLSKIGAGNGNKPQQPPTLSAAADEITIDISDSRTPSKNNNNGSRSPSKVSESKHKNGHGNGASTHTAAASATGQQNKMDNKQTNGNTATTSAHAATGSASVDLDRGACMEPILNIEDVAYEQAIRLYNDALRQATQARFALDNIAKAKGKYQEAASDRVSILDKLLQGNFDLQREESAASTNGNEFFPAPSNTPTTPSTPIRTFGATRVISVRSSPTAKK